MDGISNEIATFQESKQRAASEARQRAALQLACGIDLAAALAMPAAARAGVVARLARRLRRERLKGLSRHWSYDLDRHIAMKQALDRLTGANERGGAGAAPFSGSGS
jgi:hypothetical protein